MPGSPVHLGIALDGAGWHPAAWREPGARPDELFSARYWTDLVTEAERGLADFVTFEDALRLQSPDSGRADGGPKDDGPADSGPAGGGPAGGEGEDRRVDQVRGRLDAVLLAARVAPVTSNIGLIPAVIATHTEPFHISKAIATLDYVSTGRAGVLVKVSGREDEAAHFGRRQPDDLRPDRLLAESAEYIEVIRRLWDSWEDDAEIRDVATGRFVDRDKLHYIDFEGR
jgi:alkanesulfonate monooxygenase SsuD/methylene tetrahydromethanopterin reductase-like flavin-dependent oxidoreductase (luciferase family)